MNKTVSLLCFLLLTLSPCSISANQQVAMENLGDLSFEKNEGQLDKEFDFLLRTDGYHVGLSTHPVFYVNTESPYPTTKPENHNAGVTRQLRLRFNGAASSVNPNPKNQQQKRTNYLVGDRRSWITHVPNFERVRYANLYEGIDVEYYGNNGNLEYDFIIGPGVSTDQIKFQFEGADRVRINDQGHLIIELGDTHIVQKSPKAFQYDESGVAHTVESRYVLDDKTISYLIPEYDHSKTLVIDPVITSSRSFGGSDSDVVHSVDIDGNGNIYLVGESKSPGLGTNGVFLESNQQRRVRRLAVSVCEDCIELWGEVTSSDSGTTLIDATERFTVRNISVGMTIRNTSTGARASLSAINSDTQISHSTLAGGWSEGDGYEVFSPATWASQHVRFWIREHGQSVFVTKLSPDGSTILYTTYFNSDPIADTILALNSTAVSSEGEVAFGLRSASQSLPLINASNDSGLNYVAKLNSTGSDLLLGTYINPGGLSDMRGLDISDSGQVVAVGSIGANSDFQEINEIPGQDCEAGTSSTTFNGWISLFDADGSLSFASCLGGTSDLRTLREGLRGVSFGPEGHLYIVGHSSASDFPLVNPLQETKSFSSYRDMTLSIVDPVESEIVFSTFLGPVESGGFGGASLSSATVFPTDMRVNSQGDIWIVGPTSQFFHPTVNAEQPNISPPKSTHDIVINDTQTSGRQDLFLMRVSPTEGIKFSTYIGGSRRESIVPTLAIDHEDNAYVALMTRSHDYPMMEAIQETFEGDASFALSKYSPEGIMTFSTFIGSIDHLPEDLPVSVATNSTGQVVLAGSLQSSDINSSLSSLNTNGDLDALVVIIDSDTGPDTDADGAPDATDAFPFDLTEWRDSDTDGVGDNADQDDDNDGAPDETDLFSLDPQEWADADRDGVGDAADLFDEITHAYFDLDEDGTNDWGDSDPDGDGVSGSSDQYPYDSSRGRDRDRDGIDDEQDTDIDGDLIPNEQDPEPLDSTRPVQNFNNYHPDHVWLFKKQWPDGFSDDPWADEPWTSSFDASFTPGYSMGSGIIDHNQTTVIEYSKVFEPSLLTFRYKVDSQAGADWFRVELDGVEILTDSGDSGWKSATVSLEGGRQVLRFSYTKDGSISAGSDAAWIDDFRELTVCTETNDASDGDCKDLVSIYTSTWGEQWEIQSGWLQDNSVCSWSGVTCENNAITELDLSENGLVGSFPEVGNSLGDLKVLNLSNNSLVGTLPESIGDLSSLEILSLDRNSFQGTVPGSIGRLTNLKRLDLHSNKLSGAVPRSIVELDGLGAQINIDWNALYSNDTGVIRFLDAHSQGWRETQTLPPTMLSAARDQADSALLTWSPDGFSSGDGGYDIYQSRHGSGPFRLTKSINEKSITSVTVNKLTEFGTYFRVLSKSLPHSENANRVSSVPSNIVLASDPFSIFELNAGLNDAWISDDAPYQGIFVTVFPNLNMLFVAWFTFDSVLPSIEESAMFGSTGQRWVTALGPIEGSKASLVAELTSGGVFAGNEPSASQQADFGAIEIEFMDCNLGNIQYSFPQLSLSGNFDIVRVLPTSSSVCEALEGQ